jgi:hypothetical protein
VSHEPDPPRHEPLPGQLPLFEEPMPEDQWTLATLARLVKEMRAEQKAYFKTKETQHLDRSKQLERQVDKAIDEVFTQPRLFS